MGTDKVMAAWIQNEGGLVVKLLVPRGHAD